MVAPRPPGLLTLGYKLKVLLQSTQLKYPICSYSISYSISKMPPKRKAPAPSSSSSPKKAQKLPKQDVLSKTKTKIPKAAVAATGLVIPPSVEHKNSLDGDDSQDGLILRKYYPPELSNKRAQEYIEGDRQRPIEALKAALVETSTARHKIPLGPCVVHWFRGDLRLGDNTALHLASTMARTSKEENVALIAMYLVSPQDFEAHLTSPAKIDFILRTLEVLQEDLDKLNIPLHTEVVENRSDIPDRVLELASEWGANHVYANSEYEVDELRRDVKIIRMGVTKGVDFSVHHDLCVVKPGKLATKVP